MSVTYKEDLYILSVHSSEHVTNSEDNKDKIAEDKQESFDSSGPNIPDITNGASTNAQADRAKVQQEAFSSASEAEFSSTSQSSSATLQSRYRHCISKT